MLKGSLKRLFFHFQAEVQVGAFGGHSAARGTLQEALLDEVGFDNVFYGVRGFADGGGNVVKTDGTTAEFVQDGFEEFSVHDVQTLRVHIQHA